MKKLLCIALSLMMLLSLFSGIGVLAEETILFADDFESYAQDTVITVKNSSYDNVVKNDAKEAWGIVDTQDGNKVLKFMITAEGATGPRVVKNVDISNLKNLSVSAKVKSTGGASSSLQIYTDGASNVSFTAGNKDKWEQFRVDFDFEAATAKAYKDGKLTTEKPLKAIENKEKVEIRFYQTITNEQNTYWDDIVISTTDGALIAPTPATPAPEETKTEEPVVIAPAPTVTTTPAQKVPLIAGPDGKPVVIIKADDLSVKNYKAFKEVYDVLHKHGIVAGFGAITFQCEDFTDAQWAEIKTWVDNGFEIWHHGYKHDGVYADGVFQNDADFIGRSADKMEMYLNHGIDLFAKHGIKIQSIGAPYNKIDDTFIELVNTKFAGIITSVQYGNSKLTSAYNLTNRINIEDGDKEATDVIKESYPKKTGLPYYVLQCHAAKQDGDAIAAFEEAILWLQKESNCIFMTPSQYIEYCIAEANKAQVIEVVDETAIGGKIRVIYNGTDIDFEKYDSVYPVIENGRTLIPIRALSETLGAQVGWIEATQRVTITKDETQIIMFLDNPQATVNGVSVTLDVPPATRNDRTMVPLRFASESLNLEVKYTQK